MSTTETWWAARRQGEVITCPVCRVELYRLRRDVIEGVTPATASLFEPVGDMPEPVDGLPAPWCPNGHAWFPRWLDLRRR